MHAFRYDVIGPEELGQLVFMLEYAIDQALQAVFVISAYILAFV
jgi:hypothetical protein